jgi:hypothetical protein
LQAHNPYVGITALHSLLPATSLLGAAHEHPRARRINTSPAPEMLSRLLLPALIDSQRCLSNSFASTSAATSRALDVRLWSW